ncbi:MAG: hypothetical protein LBP95_10190 [Deltaproteobacteria bacterium]|jgi:hypothetical protein|nr:hypothetical protein [Deltaproteobacteria bacterium]
MNALSGWRCHKTLDGLFHFNRPDEDLRLIMAAFGVDYGHKRTDDLLIRNLKHNIDDFVEKMQGAGNKKWLERQDTQGFPKNCALKV